ncbi:DUF885 domain-containing protein [Candidatus Bipolaricaulota bacterium]|nr:DUF885 domain-containing protein [Candidatus Bipolaricaulota bacterium]
MKGSTEATQELEEIRKEVFDFVMKEEPIRATSMGIHEYDGELPEGSREAQERKIAKFEDWLSELSEVETGDLAGEEKDSLKTGKHILELRLFELKELRKWESNPNHPQAIGASLLPLLKRNFAPLEERLKSAGSRINQIPDFLANAREVITDPIELWIKISLESLERLPGLLGVVESTAEGSELSQTEIRELKSAGQNARKAFEKYKAWLEKKIDGAKEEFAIGPDKFEVLLEKQKLGYESDEITELGKKYLAESRKSMENYARMINEDHSVRDAIAEVEKNTPEDFSKALSWYKKSISESREFVKKKNLATIPENEDITVMETPAYLRNLIPFAAYISPAKYDETREGVYLVTPPGDQEDLSRFAFWSIRNTTVHEGYPGHHLQMSASVESDDLFALLSHATETIEGWAHYCEEMMKNYGFDDTPEARLIQMKDRRWRAARIIADVKLSTGKFSYREGVEYMADTVGMDEQSAEAEVKRYTQNPSYQLSYLLGKHKIDLLKEHVNQKMGGNYNDKFFHDGLIYGGSIPIKFHRDRFNRKLNCRD